MGKTKYQNFEWSLPKRIPSLIKGDDAINLYNAIREDEKSFPEGADLGFLDYSKSFKGIRGGSPLRTGQINNLISGSGLRVAVPGDDINKEIHHLIEGSFSFTYFNALVVHKDPPRKKENEYLWESVQEVIEEEHYSNFLDFLNFEPPVMIQGFFTIPDEKKEGNYLKIVPASDFKVIRGDMFEKDYDGWYFSEVDEDGIPKYLDKSKGFRRLYTKGRGLCGVGFSQLRYDLHSNEVISYSEYLNGIVLLKDPKTLSNQRTSKFGKEIDSKKQELDELRKEYDKRLEGILKR